MEENADGPRPAEQPDDEPRVFTPTAKLGFLIAVIGIVGTGIADFALTNLAGAPDVGRTVWAVGFGLTVVTLWYLFVRPLDLSGP